ncbi:MAG: hypothetical protein Q9159_005578 [Coniocarpon cinnabarinum]
MVLKQTVSHEMSPPYPTTPSDSQPQPAFSSDTPPASQSTGQAQRGLADLGIQDDADVEESSDWDASDREDNDTTKMIDDRPSNARRSANQGNVSHPHLAEHQIPEPLRLKKPASPQPNSDSFMTTSNPSESNPPPAIPSQNVTQPVKKQNTNPFRRPSDLTAGEHLSNTASTDGNVGLISPEATHASAYQSESFSNPWADESHLQRPDLPSVQVPPPSTDLWAEEGRIDDQTHRDEQQQSNLTEDKSYIANLIDFGDDETRNHPARNNTAADRPSMDEHSRAGSAVEKDVAHTQGNQSQPPAPPRGQRNEFYQIRNIHWHDPQSKKNPRQSPILMQNANGPCPLLALVNALSLSTPPDTNTILIDTLQARETMSLGLLLDAVFDELMSGRRGATAQQLPDVSELYSFLITLHTGMNVNPRFVPDADSTMFEQTKEMLLYSTFAIPLVHGWIPSSEDPAHAAFKSTAVSYEDAQHVQFREEELEQKLGRTELTTEEQNVLQDLPVIKQFFAMWPTQLTEHGLRSLKEDIKPGQIVILFRNDHFSTVFKDPKSHQLMTLVTDAGYTSHEEIVWESLADINGAKSELFSGDFRCVSHGNQAAPSSGQNDRTTVHGRRSKTNPAPAEPRPGETQNPPTISRAPTEQEDADLALALRLQDEEEQRQREDQAARQREERLSRNYLDNESARRGPRIPPRGRRNPSQTTAPPPQSGDELPSYEQAASQRSYQPPPGQPGAGQPTTATSYGALPEQRVGMGRVPGQAIFNGRRRGRPGATPFDNSAGVSSAQAVSDRREGCTIM